jgi:DNA-binding MarR family transcriptional regulator
VHAQLLEEAPPPLVELANQLMAMIVHPYLGAAAARRELTRAEPPPSVVSHNALKDPFSGLPIRFTYRTARVLAAICSQPAASNRVLADASGIGDEGQISRLLRRLEDAGLVENLSAGRPKGEPNAWTLTARGEAVHAALDAQAAYPAAA